MSLTAVTHLPQQRWRLEISMLATLSALAPVSALTLMSAELDLPKKPAPVRASTAFWAVALSGAETAIVLSAWLATAVTPARSFTAAAAPLTQLPQQTCTLLKVTE